MKVRSLVIASAVIVSFATAEALAQTRWLHVRGHELDGGEGRIAVNLPLRSAMAVTRTIATSGNAHLEVSGHRIRIDTIADGWASLRERPAGEVVTFQRSDGSVTFARTASGMSMSSIDRWSGEQTEVEAISALLDAFASGALLESEIAAAVMSLPSGVPVLTSRNTDARIVVWVDESPEGVLP